MPIFCNVIVLLSRNQKQKNSCVVQK